MHIKATNLLAGEVGTKARFIINDGPPELADVTLCQPLTAWIDLYREPDGLSARGQVAGSIQLECHRCLRAFEWAIQVEPSGRFSLHPLEDEWKIAGDGTLDLAPMIRQEILLNIPLQQLCAPDCPGLCDTCGQLLADKHHH